ncbi:MAG: hypothetical protein AABY46_03970 [Nitrospirota bacterium]
MLNNKVSRAMRDLDEITDEARRQKMIDSIVTFIEYHTELLGSGLTLHDSWVGKAEGLVMLRADSITGWSFDVKVTMTKVET